MYIPLKEALAHVCMHFVTFLKSEPLKNFDTMEGEAV